MGWSFTAKAGLVMDAWTDYCIAQTGSQNVFISKGEKVFWETERKDHRDGAITGEIIGYDGYKKSNFRIRGDGTIAQAPKVLINAAIAAGCQVRKA